MRQILVVCLLLAGIFQVRAQKIGLVFSGGGAKGLAHIGVLKALEENHIPIDYIIGTSMGGVVAGMYAAGYAPAEIERIALSHDFQDWVSGRFKSDYQYYFNKQPENPAFLTAKLQIDTGFQARIRSNLVNDVPLNFALLELLAQPSVSARNNFDSLFVPFRCMVADVLSQQAIAVKSGSLIDAVRGTLTVPLVYRPIKVDGRYVFDGGLYDNFPVGVMKKEFAPDYIIGANVSSKVFNSYPDNIDEKLMNRFLVYMFLSKSDSTTIGKNGVYIQPDVTDFSATGFGEVAGLIKKGYDATMAEMPKLLAEVKRRTSAQALEKRRTAFNSKNAFLVFNNIRVTGLNSKQRYYVTHVLRQSRARITMQEIREGYYRLVADNNFETVYPRIIWQPETETYEFELQAQPQRNFRVALGGNIASRPVSNIYLGLQYNYLHRKSYTFSTGFYSGRFYESIQTQARMDIPNRIPLYLEGEFTYNHWNFYNTNQILAENVNPVYATQADSRMVVKAGIPLARNGKIEAHAGYTTLSDKYSPDNSFQAGDILDHTRFYGWTGGITVGKNTLNRKQYPSNGFYFNLSADYFTGTEKYTPGNIYRDEPFYAQIIPETHRHDWFKIKATSEQYVLTRRHYSLGYLAEAVLSNKPAFSNYLSTVLSAPAFFPLQDSRSLFLRNFRANTYGAFGLKNVFPLRKHLDARLEGYFFLPLEEFRRKPPQDVGYAPILSTWHYAATAGLVYHSPAGPVSLSFNQYDDDQKRYGVLLHIGYLLYNKRSFD